MTNRLLHMFLAVLTVVTLHTSAYASEEDLVIQDVNGVTRASSPVDGVGKIEFNVIDASGAPANGAEITLTNATSGEVLTTNAVNGTVSFEGVNAGVWTVASNTVGVTFTDVAVTGSIAAASAAGGGLAGLGLTTGGAAALGGGAIAVGGAVAAASTDGGSGSTTTPISPHS